MTEQEMIGKGWYKSERGGWMKKGVHINLTAAARKNGGLTLDDAIALDVVIDAMQKKLEKA